jgi:hypothetical protein
MTVPHSWSTDLVAPRRKGSKRVHCVVADHIERDDVSAPWLGVPFFPVLLILDGGTTFRSQKGAQFIAQDMR